MSALLPQVALDWLQQSGGGAGAAASGALTAAYRAGHSSAAPGFDLKAYAAARLPATYAATAWVLDELSRRAPAYAPDSLLDLGAGPGTASWAAASRWPSITRIQMLEQLPAFRALARDLCSRASASVLQAAGIEAFDLTRDALPAQASLVVAAYALIELPENDLPAVLARAWEAAGQALVIVEPGTPRAFERLLGLRRLLLERGARLLAPCPQADECPLAAPDWCHFSVRVPRSRAHMQAKSARVPFEDEKFCYLIAVRDNAAATPPARILRPPLQLKHGVEFHLCTPAGLARRMVASRDKRLYKQARKLGWGDGFPDAGERNETDDT